MSAVLAFEKPGKPVERGIEHFWSIIRDLDRKGSWTINDVWRRSTTPHQGTVNDFISRLVAGGFVQPTGDTVHAGDRKLPLHRLAGHAPPRAPRLRRDGSPALQGRGQQQMWNVMRGPSGRDGFTFHDVSLYGATDEIAVSKEAARAYCLHLYKAGYLLLLKPGGPNRAALYRLKPAMNTGPRPPLILRAKVVVDQNRMTAMGPIEAEEVAS